MRRTAGFALSLALAFALAAPAFCAEPGARGAQDDSAAPTKKVEEPVFQLPELVIIGENQARIMAQKERLAGTPLKGLREAPLLEKEESALAGIRERLPLEPGGSIREGTFGLARLEGGLPGWGGGAFWVGRQTARTHTSLGLFGSQLQGEDAAGETAGGRELGISAGTGFISGAGGYPVENRRLAGLLALLGSPDSASARLGWRRQSRDLPYLSSGRQRHFDRFSLNGEAARSLSGFSAAADMSFARLRVPQETITAGMAGASGRIRLWQVSRLAVSFEPDCRVELAETAGNRTSLGTRLKAAWISGERWRLSAGLTAEGIWGDGVSAGLASPAGGVSWTSPWGPTLAAEFGAGLAVPWMTGQAAAVPYSRFTSRLVPARTRTDVKLSAWQEHWSGSRVELSYRGRDIRSALSWDLRPAEGLFEPAALSRLRLNELSVSWEFRNAAPLLVKGGAVWRGIGARGGEAANLANGEGSLGAGYDFGRIRLDAELGVVGPRPGSFSGTGDELAGYENLKVRLTWLAEEWLRVYLGMENALGRRIELWQGYPEPKHLFSAGVLAAF